MKGVCIMDKKFQKLLYIIAITGVVTAAILAFIGRKEISEHYKEGMKDLDKRMKDKENRKKFDMKRSEMLLIAKQMNRDIKGTETRTSEEYHNKNKEKYHHLWGDKYSHN